MIFSGLRWHGLRMSFGNWLTCISLLALLPMLAFSVFVVHRLLMDSQEQEIAALTRRTALAADAVGRELDRARTAARVVSLSNVAVRGDFEGLHTLASRVVGADPTLDLIGLGQRDGRRIFSTTRPWGEVGATRPLLEEEMRVIDDNIGAVSPIVPTSRPGVMAIGIAHPLQVEGGTRYSLRVAVKQSSLGATLADRRWPEDWRAMIVDQRMNVVAHWPEEAGRLGQSVTEELATRLRVGQTEPFVRLGRDGKRILTVKSRVPDSDWWVVVGLPEAEHEARAREPLMWISLAGLLLVGLGVAGTTLLGRELTRQVRHAAQGETAGELTVRELQHLETRTLRTTEALRDARHDALTGLASRSLFIEQAQALQVGASARSEGLAALFIDLDGFKQANDRLGHTAGDRILAQVADVLRRNTRAHDCCARLGGDEFVVALAAPLDQLQRVGEGVAARIVRDVAALGEQMGCSIGVATAPAGTAIATLLDRADHAMLAAKRLGKGRVEIAPETV